MRTGVIPVTKHPRAGRGVHVGEPSPFLLQTGKLRQGRVPTEFTQQVRGNAGLELRPLHHTLLSPPPGKDANLLRSTDVYVLSHFSCVRLFMALWTGSPPGSSVREDSPGENTGVGCHALLQGIFPTQGLNLSFLRFLHW